MIPTDFVHFPAYLHYIQGFRYKPVQSNTKQKKDETQEKGPPIHSEQCLLTVGWSEQEFVKAARSHDRHGAQTRCLVVVLLAALALVVAGNKLIGDLFD